MATNIIGGRYSVIERVGKGAMGVVFKAHDPVLDRTVAVKKMVAEIGEDEGLRKRFYAEARAAARMNHRNIVTIHELSETEEGEIFIVMELLEGVDLATIIKRKVNLPLEAKLTIMAQVCDGLDYAHAQGIVHRDIKPANLHLSPAGLVKILDFGIARLASSHMTGTGALIGTPDYMSPEQVMGESVDQRSDLFAIGAVLYELVSGHKPFNADSVTSLLMKIARDPHIPLSERTPDAPLEVIDLVDRLLSKDRNARPANAGAVRDELNAIVARMKGLSGAAAVEMIGGVVTEQTMLASTPLPGPGTGAGTPLPPTGRSGAPSRAAAPPPAREDSTTRLATLTIKRGREARERGDLAEAMESFRSVLEVAPGHPEALQELEYLERSLREASAARTAAPAPAIAPTVITAAAASETALPATAIAPAVALVATAPMPAPAVAPAPPRPAARSGAPLALVAVLVAVFAIGGGGFFLWSRMNQPAAPAAEQTTPPATTGTAPAPPQAAAPSTPTSVANVPATPQPRTEAPPATTQPTTTGSAARGTQPSAPPSRAADAGRRAEAAPPGEPERPAGAPAAPQRVEPPPPVVVPSEPPARSVDTATIETLTGRRGGQAYAGLDLTSTAASAARIRAVIEQYREALENRDLATLRRVRSQISPAEQSFIDAPQKVTIRFEDLRVDASPTDGAATCRRVVERPSGPPAESAVSFRLVRQSTGWVITDVR